MSVGPMAVRSSMIIIAPRGSSLSGSTPVRTFRSETPVRTFRVGSTPVRTSRTVRTS